MGDKGREGKEIWHEGSRESWRKPLYRTVCTASETKQSSASETIVCFHSSARLGVDPPLLLLLSGSAGPTLRVSLTFFHGMAVVPGLSESPLFSAAPSFEKETDKSTPNETKPATVRRLNKQTLMGLGKNEAQKAAWYPISEGENCCWKAAPGVSGFFQSSEEADFPLRTRSVPM